jgi:hypothetical protein
MSVQVFLQGKLLGVEGFLQAPATGVDGSRSAEGDRILAGRSRWVALLIWQGRSYPGSNQWRPVTGRVLPGSWEPTPPRRWQPAVRGSVDADREHHLVRRLPSVSRG